MYSNKRIEEEKKKHVSMRLVYTVFLARWNSFGWHGTENVTLTKAQFGRISPQPLFCFCVLCSDFAPNRKNPSWKNALNYHRISQFIIFCKNVSDSPDICLFFVYLPLEDILMRRLKGDDTIACNSTFTKKGLCTKAQIFRDSFFFCFLFFLLFSKLL